MRLGLGLGIDNALAGGGSASAPGQGLDISFATGVPIDAGGVTLQENQTPEYPFVRGGYNKGLFCDQPNNTNVSTDGWDNDLSGDTTIAMWVKNFTTGESYGKFFSNGQFSMQWGFNRSVTWSGMGGAVGSFGQWMPYDVWTHIVITKNSSGDAIGYWNGKQLGTLVNVGTTVSSAGEMIIGAHTIAGANNADQVVSTFKVLSEVLDASAVLALYNAEVGTYDEIIEKPDYYVKNGGSDASDGLSDATAWETVSKANAVASGSVVGFNRGDTWTGDDLEPANDNVRYIDYGDTALAKPIITGNIYGFHINKSSAFLCSVKNIHFKNSAGTYTCYIAIDTVGNYVEFEGCIFEDVSDAYTRITELSNVWFRDCEFRTGAGTECLSSESTGMVGVEDSIIDSAGVYGIKIAGVSTTGTIRRNVISAKTIGIQLDRCTSVHVGYNLIKDLTNSGSTYGIVLDGTALDDIHIFNNTIHLDGISESEVCYGLYGDSGVTFAGACSFKNNIVYILNSDTAYFVSIAMDFTANLVLDNNCYYDTAGNKAWKMNVTNYFSLANWKTGISDEVLSINSDPDFIDFVDFKLDTTSPALALGGIVDENHVDFIPEDKAVDVALGYVETDIDQTVPRHAIPVDEKIVNGDMSDNSNWEDVGSPLQNVRGGAPYKSVSYSRHLIADSGDGAKSDNFSVEKGKTYRIMAWVYPESGTMTMDASTAIAFTPIANAGTGAWELFQVDFKATADSSVVNIRFKSTSSGATWEMDDVSVNELVALDPDSQYLYPVSADSIIFFPIYKNVEDDPIDISFDMIWNPGNSVSFGTKRTDVFSYVNGYSLYCASDRSLVLYESGPSANTIIFRSAGGVLTAGTWHKVRLRIKTDPGVNPLLISLDGTATLPATQAGLNPANSQLYKKFTQAVVELRYQATDNSAIRNLIIDSTTADSTSITNMDLWRPVPFRADRIRDKNRIISPLPIFRGLDLGAQQDQDVKNLLFNGNFATKDLTGWDPVGSWEYAHYKNDEDWKEYHCLKFADSLTGYINQADPYKVVWVPGATYVLSWTLLDAISSTSCFPRIGTSTIAGLVIGYTSFQNYYGRKTLKFTLGAGPYSDGLNFYATTSNKKLWLTDLELIKIS